MPARGIPSVGASPDGQVGVTILEMLIALSLLFVLASVAMPVAKMVTKRNQELELRQKLREMRMAIDQFRLDWARDGDTLLGAMCKDNKLSCKLHTGLTGYPKKLETLLSVELTSEEAALKLEKVQREAREATSRDSMRGSDSKTGKEYREGKSVSLKRYLRRIPIDPMMGKAEWGLRCYSDPPDTNKWCEEDVYDVYSLSPDLAIDNTKYRDW